MRAVGAAFQQNYSSRVAETFATMDGPSILTISGHLPKPLVNFVLHVQQVSAAEGKSMPVVANALLDQASIDACRQMQRNEAPELRVACIDLVGWMPSDPRKSGELDKKSVGYVFMYWWTKPVVLNAAVQASEHGVMMMDLDVVLYQDLLGYAQATWQERPEVLLLAGYEFGKWFYNTGTVYAGRRSLPFLNLWVQENDCTYRSSAGDQTALNSLLQSNLTQIGATRKQFWMIPLEMVGQQCVKGSFATHYNCLEKAASGDESVLSSRGDWADVDDVLSTGAQASLAHAMIKGHDWLLGNDVL